ncbi:MAG TPA: hypothetical protein CFH81_05820 [Sulfurovum sp. UBA12169]|nr:MAG TPA: hypothetical protein CFH81_05820 [Sulfurovum sp. UBA12169]
MLILIPVESVMDKKSRIATLADKKAWALVKFENGEIQYVQFFENRTAIGEEWIDFVILENKFENYMEFMQEGMMVLVRRQEESIEEIMEAFKFKELDEIGVG